jgi:hypothetical protein
MAMHIDRCRVCESRRLELILDLGHTALANRFLRPEQATGPEPRFPLRVVLCEDCGLVQIDEVVPPEVLFKDYIYVTGTSDLAKSHAAHLASQFTRELEPGDLVVEAASNDGTVLQAFQKHGVRTVGIDPAANIVAVANRNGVETVCDFFGVASARALRDRSGPARFFLARHVLAHVADLHDFVRGIHALLDSDGVAAVEVPHLVPFYDKLEFDTVYHEHLCYFSLRVLKTLFAHFDLEVIDVEEVSIHGGAILAMVQHQGGARRPSASLSRILHEEERRGLHRVETWADFGRRVAACRKGLRHELDRLRTAGLKLAGYGAAAKGMTLLAACGIGPEELPFIVDKNPLKQGLLTPGHHIPVRPVEDVRREGIDVLLLLAWNFADEIVRQQDEFLRGGGRFLLPIPAPHFYERRMAA